MDTSQTVRGDGAMGTPCTPQTRNVRSTDFIWHTSWTSEVYLLFLQINNNDICNVAIVAHTSSFARQIAHTYMFLKVVFLLLEA